MRHAVGIVIVLVMSGAAAPGWAQDGGEHIDFDRPEAWAMQYFAAVSTFTGLGPPVRREPWSVDLGLDLGWIPSLSEAERTVGYNGTKVEDLNRLPVFGRPRVTVGLPGGFSADLGWVPPIEINGVTSNLFAAAVERPVLEHERWTLGLRAYGQLGDVTGDFTCPEDVASQAPGSPGNPYGCNEPSSDTSTLNNVGLALTGGAKIGGGGLVHLSGGATYNDLAFQVDAVTYGYPDHTRLLADGWTGWVAAGLGWPLGARTWVAGEAFYSPLWVVRPPDTSRQNDGLFNLRVLLRFHLD
jgi:hypothetical protein